MISTLLLLTIGCSLFTGDSADGGKNDGDNTPVDSDEDGLTDAEEAELGTDPDAADSDEDGFDDGAEFEAGTNPTYVWSHPFEDGDYLVGDCPTPPDEDAAGPTGTGSYDTYSWDSYQEGDVIHNVGVGGWDAFEQEVPLYSFCGNYVVVTQSAEWCGPCQDLAADMADHQETIRETVPNFIFYELLYQNNRGGEPNANTLGNWSEEFELAGIPVVSPEDNTSQDMNWLNGSGGIPATLLIAPDGTVIWSVLDRPREYYLYDADQILEAIADYEGR
jgi:thiol-disulfide isomerase/thioredoxin